MHAAQLLHVGRVHDGERRVANGDGQHRGLHLLLLLVLWSGTLGDSLDDAVALGDALRLAVCVCVGLA